MKKVRHERSLGNGLSLMIEIKYAEGGETLIEGNTIELALRRGKLIESSALTFDLLDVAGPDAVEHVLRLAAQRLAAREIGNALQREPVKLAAMVEQGR